MTRPNILFVILDATRADACSCYGAKQPTTPNLDALAAEGTLYEQAISPAPWTLPAIASLFTGLFPHQIGIYERRQLAPSVPTLAFLLSQHGYRTFGISGNGWMSADFGLQRGFDRFHKLWQLVQVAQDINELVVLDQAPTKRRTLGLLHRWRQGSPLKNIINTAYNSLWAYHRDYGASRTLRPLLRWIKAQPSPWFAFVHYLEPHLEFRPPQPWARRFAADWERARRLMRQDQMRLAWRHMAGVERLTQEDLKTWRDLYLAEVAYTDWHLGLLVEALAREGYLSQTAVIVSADHGESLGEHGLLNHQYGVYDTLLRVPLIIRYPARFPVGGRVSRQAQTLDLFPTILEIAEVEVPSSSGKSLRVDSEDAHPFVVAEYGIPRLPPASHLRRFGLQPSDLQPFARGFVALRSDPYKLIVGTDGSVTLYNWRQDPGEENDLAAEQPTVVQGLQNTLQHWQAKMGKISMGGEETGEMDPMAVARLRALGYIE